MSTYESYAGMAIKLHNQDENYVKKIANQLEHKEWDEDEFGGTGLYFDIDSRRLNKWSIKRDYNGVYGLIYLTNYSWDNLDLDFKLSIKDINDIITELNPDIEFGHDDIKVIAYNYYNGSDDPFTF